MSLSVDGNDYLTNASQLSASAVNSSAKTDALASEIKSASSDDEMMEACKSFESYMVEQVIKNVGSDITSDEEDSSGYLSMFKDNMYEDLADKVTDSGTLGIAEQLYESMKRNYGSGVTDASGDSASDT
jgi:peptidoglycan hydrolase FlgJ